MTEKEKIEIDMSDSNTWPFKIIIAVKLKKMGIEKKYVVFAKGEVTRKGASRKFTENVHGMYIKNYVEESVQEIKD